LFAGTMTISAGSQREKAEIVAKAKAAHWPGERASYVPITIETY